jgi:adenylate kinase
MPGSGKGTQGLLLGNIPGFFHMSTGDMFRTLDHHSEIGRLFDEYSSRGELVPDEVVIGMVRERFAQPDVAAGFMLDGFPRTVAQADALDAALTEDGITLDAVVLLEVDDELIVNRIVGRRSDPETGTIYHLEFSPPPAEIAHRLVHRKDDTEEACRTRLSTYHAQTAPIIPFYEAKGLVKRIDGVGAPDEVSERIFAALD